MSWLVFNHLDPNAIPPSTPEKESTTGPVVAMTTDGGDGDEEGGEGTCFNCYLLCLAWCLINVLANITETFIHYTLCSWLQVNIMLIVELWALYFRFLSQLLPYTLGSNWFLARKPISTINDFKSDNQQIR